MADMSIALETTTVELSSLPSNESDSSAGASSLNVHYVVWVFLLPVVVIIGVTGNVLSIIVLLSKAFRHTTTGVYLPLTAVADIVFLLTGAQETLEVAGVFSIREHNVWTCRFYKVIFYTAGDVSIWLLVAFTFDRFIAVCFPLSKQRVCRWTRAVVASAVIASLSTAKNLHEFWTRGPEFTRSGQFRRICGSQPEYHFFLQYVRPWIVFVVITAVPFLLILCFNCTIVHALIRAQRLRSAAVATPTGTGSKPPTPAASGFRQTTFMCLGISFAFLVCVSPSIVLLIGKPYWLRDYRNIKSVCNLFGFVNHAINFFLYCVTGRRFRHQLTTMLSCRRQGTPQTPTTTQNCTSAAPTNESTRTA